MILFQFKTYKEHTKSFTTHEQNRSGFEFKACFLDSCGSVPFFLVGARVTAPESHSHIPHGKSYLYLEGLGFGTLSKR